MDKRELTDSLVKLIAKAEYDLPVDVEAALKRALEKESFETARVQLQEILRNIELAREKRIPLCQDTGILNFYVSLGRDSGLDLDMVRDAIFEATKLATEEVPLRPNAVHPLTRENSEDNTGENIPVIEFESVPGSQLGITVFPKGAGSENMSKLSMLKPSDGLSGVKDFIFKSVLDAAGKACPPGIIGVGLGGSSDLATRLAKKALLREVGERHPDPSIAGLESELEERLNSSGIGAMGLGGKTTCLAVHVEYAFCHTGSLPVAINTGCWATRKAKMIV